MAQALFNFNVSLPLSSRGRTVTTLGSKSTNLSVIPTGSGFGSTRIKAVAGDNMDYLQRSGKHQPQTQPKKRLTEAAPIGLWDRFPSAKTLQQLMDTMERMMEDPFAYNGSLAREGGGYNRGRTPWEIKEGEGEYKMRFDMPGMTKEDVKVWVEEKMLVVKAEKVPKNKNGNEEQEEDEWSAKSYGRYSSRIALPENIQFEKIKAEVKDGVLYITIPKASINGKVFDINVK